MPKVQHITNILMYSLPVQLAKAQIRHYKFLLLFWFLLLGIIYEFVGSSLGGNYLLLEPEYLGEENFWSSFLVGSALGIFLFAYKISLYINESYRFHFIANVRSPFLLFAHNNFLLPTIFIALYIFRFIEFHAEIEGYLSWSTMEKTTGLLLGMSLVFLFLVGYFFARRTLINRAGKVLQEEITKTNPTRSNWVILGKAKDSFQESVRTDTYIDFPFQIKEVPNDLPVGIRSLVSTLSQHHGKLLIFQIIGFLLIATLGFLEEDPFFQIPTGASLLLALAVVMMAFGAITFWFRKVGLFIFLIGGMLIFAYNHFHFMHDHHHAFGLNYEVPPSTYTQSHVDSLAITHYEADKALALQGLNNWLQNRRIDGYDKPNAIFLSASGGGLRSAYWTFRILQHVDSLSMGKVSPDIRLMTGASGGMFGLAYFRELYLREIKQEVSDRFAPQYFENISKDLLNRIWFRYYTDIFLPNLKINIDGKVYDRETGLAFDQQLESNLPEFKDRKLADYADWELKGKIPQLILTPTILNQGKKLYISANPVSYMAKPEPITSNYQTKGRGIDFQHFFKEQEADQLRFSTALRMNATFPYILPIVELPSDPVMAVMDAGAMDNYGSQEGVKFLYEFKSWFAQNTGKVLFIIIRDNMREDPIEDIVERNLFNKLISPVGAGYYSITESRDLTNEALIKYVQTWYPGEIEVFSFEYPRELSKDPASLSFHLTQREKANIRSAIHTKHNQHHIQRLLEIYDPQLIVKDGKSQLPQTEIIIDHSQ